MELIQDWEIQVGGIIEFRNNRLIHVDDGRISPPSLSSVGERLLFIKNKLSLIVKKYDPNISAIEQIFVGPGTGSSLKLGMARGVSNFSFGPRQGLQIKELPPKLVKKQLQAMALLQKIKLNQW